MGANQIMSQCLIYVYLKAKYLNGIEINLFIPIKHLNLQKKKKEKEGSLQKQSDIAKHILDC